MRLPPTLKAEEADKKLKELFETNPPYGAEVKYESVGAMSGWNAPLCSPYLSAALNSSSKNFYGKE